MSTELHNTLPIHSELAFKIGDDAIGLFLEYRDRYGYGEDEARQAALVEVAEGASADVDAMRDETASEQ